MSDFSRNASVVLLAAIASTCHAQLERNDHAALLNYELRLLKKVAAESPCHRALLVAFKNAQVRRLFLDHAESECSVLRDICCLEVDLPEHVHALHFDFECASACSCLLDPSFRVDINVETGRVTLGEIPYRGPFQPCRSLLKDAGFEKIGRESALIREQGDELSPGTKDSDGRERIYRVTDLDVSLDAEENRAVISAEGQTRTGGWSGPQLIEVEPPSLPLRFINPRMDPPEGLTRYRFSARPPEGIATQAIAPIEAPPVTARYMLGSRGVIVEAEENEMTVRYLLPIPEDVDPDDNVILTWNLRDEGVSDYELNGASMKDGILTVDVAYEGDCTPHQFSLWWNEEYQESDPPQVRMWLLHDDLSDDCDGEVSEILHFALPQLQPCLIVLGDYRAYRNAESDRTVYDDAQTLEVRHRLDTGKSAP